MRERVCGFEAECKDHSRGKCRRLCLLNQAGKGLQWVLWKGIEQFLERESRRAFWWAQSTCRKGVWWERAAFCFFSEMAWPVRLGRCQLRIKEARGSCSVPATVWWRAANLDCRASVEVAK